MFGVPVRAPVDVLRLIPGGVVLILKLAIAPPVELMVKPVAVVLTVLLSEDAERVNAGAATARASPDDVSFRTKTSSLPADPRLLVPAPGSKSTVPRKYPVV